MTIYATGKDIYLRQGDTGNISFSNIPTDESYSVYLSVYDPDTDSIIGETLATSFNQVTGRAVFALGASFTNSLPVGDWVYGVKICYDGTEDTLLPRTTVTDGKLVKENAPKFTVDYKYVEGTINE